MSAKLDIEYIELRNFLSYGDYVTRLEVANLGPVLILGEIDSEDNTKSSNGAGKSSLLAAFIWCLFGRIIVNPNPGDRVVNWFNGKNCYVKIKTANDLEIIRTRACDGQSELILRQNGDDKTKSTNQNAQKKISELFGLNYDIFTSSVFCGQFGKSFLEMSPIKRKETIEKLLGLDRLNQYADIAKNKYQQVEHDQETTRSKIGLLRADVERQQNHLTENKQKQDFFENERSDRLKRIQDKIQEVKNQKTEIDLPDMTSLKRKWDLANTISTKLEKYRSRINQNQLKICSLDELLEQFKHSLKNYQNWNYSSLDLNELKKQHELFEQASIKLKELSDLFSEARSEIKHFDKEKKLLETKLDDWDIKSNTNCNSCGQLISGEHAYHQMSCLKSEISQLEQRRHKAVLKSEKLEEAIQIIETVKRPDTSLAEAERINQVSSRISKEVKSLNNSISKTDGERQNLVEENKNLDTIIKSTLDKFENLKPKITIDQAHQLQSSLNILKEREENLFAQYQSITQEGNPYVKIIADLTEVIKKLEDELNEHDIELKNLDVLFSHYKYIYRSYNDRRKIKSWLLSELIPFLNDRVHYYLDMLGVDIEVKFSSTLNAETDKWDYEFCSGGERKRIDLAIMFGLYDLYVSIYGQQCNIMVLDEVDSRLDNHGIEAFAEIVNDICTNNDRPRPSTIFVISHKQELISMFPSQVLIKKKGTFSYIDQTIFTTDQT